ncbi:MAG: hypothetical protein BGO41_11165 [Clostridiales bacterium 38-18]|nr:MAG: hypothetical protein BGO41_11165 [Clostridiales bacterium 38-18]
MRINRKIGILLLVIVSLSFTGCQYGTDYKDYIEASDRTDQIKKGAVSFDFSMDNQMSELVNNSDDETLKQLGTWLKTIVINGITRFDRDNQSSITELNYKLAGLGNDVTLYQPANDEMYIKLPFDSRWFSLPKAENSDQYNAFGTALIAIGSEWAQMMQKENIFIGEKTIIQNEAGDIKATKFTVRPTAEQLDTFQSKLKVVLQNNVHLLNGMLKEQFSGVEMSDEELGQLISALFDSIEIGKYEEVAYMDMDGYLVDQTIYIEIAYHSSSQMTNLFESQKIELHISYFDIEKNQSMDFSEIQKDSAVPIDALRSPMGNE